MFIRKLIERIIMLLANKFPSKVCNKFQDKFSTSRLIKSLNTPVGRIEISFDIKSRNVKFGNLSKALGSIDAILLFRRFKYLKVGRFERMFGSKRFKLFLEIQMASKLLKISNSSLGIKFNRELII